MTKQPYSAPQVAKMVGVHPQTVRKWVEDGDLTGHRVRTGKRWRIYRDDLEEFCERSGFRIVDERPE